MKPPVDIQAGDPTRHDGDVAANNALNAFEDEDTAVFMALADSSAPVDSASMSNMKATLALLSKETAAQSPSQKIARVPYKNLTQFKLKDATVSNEQVSKNGRVGSGTSSFSDFDLSPGMNFSQGDAITQLKQHDMIAVESILNDIYSFPHCEPSFDQSESTIQIFLTLFKSLLTHLEHDSTHQAFPIAEDYLADLSKALRGMNSRTPTEFNPKVVHRWFPEFGCALVLESVDMTEFSLQLLFLDKWEYYSRRRGTGHHDEYSSPSLDSVGLIHVGTVEKELFDSRFAPCFNDSFSTSRKRYGEQRSAASGQQGHQKTPAFIKAVLLQTLTAMQVKAGSVDPFVPFGATTDVGLHTGGKPRSTSWPLAVHALKTFLPTQDMFLQTISLLDLFLLGSKVASVENSPNLIANDSDECCVMIKTTTERLIALQSATDISIEKAADCVVQLESRLTAHVESFTKKNSFSVPSEGDLIFTRANLSQKPTPLDPGTSGLSLDEVHKLRNANIGALPLLDIQRIISLPDRYSVLLKWANSVLASCEGINENMARLLVMRSFDAFFWVQSTLLTPDYTGFDLDSNDVVCLKELVVLYQKTSISFLTSNGGKSLMKVKERSYDLLVVCIATSLVHKFNCIACPLMAEYAISLHWKNLEPAVLKDQRAVDALLRLKLYWQQCTVSKLDPVFSLAVIDGTLDFALRFALGCRQMIDRWAVERNNAARRKKNHEHQVTTKKRKAANLRNELTELKQKLREAQSNLREQQTDLNGLNSYDDDFDNARRNVSFAKQDVNSATQQVNSKEEAIAREIKTPQFVKNPLPQHENEAMVVIYFTLIPQDHHILSELLVLSRKSFNPVENFPVEAHANSWMDHYKSCDTGSDFAKSEFSLHPLALHVPTSYGPSTVDGISTDSSSCVWYPNGLKNAMSISSGTNPWATTTAGSRQAFIEALVGESGKLQWILNYPCMRIDSSRGNQVFAAFPSKPANFTRLQFEVAGNLRAFPNQQIRKIINLVLREKNLPLDDQLSAILVQQALYQVGEISESGTDLVWKTDLYKMDAADSLHNELAFWVDLIAQTPKNYESMIVLWELVSFLSQFDKGNSTKFGDLAREYSAVASGWAAGIRADIAKDPTLSAPARLELKAKECLINGYAIICLSHLPSLTTEDAGRMCELLARYNVGTVFAPDSSLKLELASMHSKVLNCMARQFICMKQTMQFTDLTILVNKLLSMNLPIETTWKSSNQFCYVETFSGGHLYTFNFMSGCILLDGMPPGRLPAGILNAALYKKHFGDRDFEVRTVGPVLQTVERLAGNLYQFFLVKNRLLVREINPEGRVLELVEFSKASWWTDLPVSLHELYSHWYCHEKQFLVFRPHPILKKDISYLVDWAKSSGVCYEVKSHLSALPIDKILEGCNNFNQFVVLTNPVSSIRLFGKLEWKEFIHTLSTPNDTIIVSFPRFKLSFVHCLATGTLQSNEYKGFHLRTDQRLDNSALALFNQYLILAGLTTNQTLVLIPDGRVVMEGNEARILLSRASFDSYKAITFETAPYSGDILLSKCVADRLQLAAICSASGTLLKDPAYKMTGTDMAISLVRQSWVGRPYTKVELEKLCDVMKFAYREPALGVLCAHVKFFASRLSFLHTKSPVEEITDPAFQQTAVWAGSQFVAEASKDFNIRRQLSPLELIPTFRSLPYSTLSKLPRQNSVALEPFSGAPKDIVSKMERDQARALIVSTPVQGMDFPLNHASKNDALDEAISKDLERSWESHTNNPSIQELTKNRKKKLRTAIKTHELEVLRIESDVTKYLKQAFIGVPVTSKSYFDLLRVSNALPTPIFSDLMKMACDPRVIRSFNPYLNNTALGYVHDAILLLLQLTVFKAKLSRMRMFLDNHSQLVKEIFEREWSVLEYPKWLVFEVEGGLQIRPNQHSMAVQLIKNPGSIVQLNMGEGKTRVIMPMIILALSDKHLIRVNVLTQLFQEAGSHLHSALTASVLGIKILDLPFHRLVKLDAVKISKMLLATRMISEEAGFVMAAPEHRLSLYLKIEEMKLAKSPDCDALDNLYRGNEYFELFDESDAILTCKYQLIYAVGTHESLPNGTERWTMIHAILRVLSSNDTIQSLLSSSPYATHASDAKKFEFNQVRLIEGLAESDDKSLFLETLRRSVLEELVSAPPTDLKWITEMMSENNDFKNDVMEAVLNPKKPIGWIAEKYDNLDEMDMAKLLMLRGLLSYGLLEHCLSMRHAVNYGVDAKRAKHMAVPFLAVDVPSEAAEYSHADVAIVLTTLSYYYIGLSHKHVEEALRALMTLSPEAQKNNYSLWFEQVKCYLTAAEKLSIDNVSKLDMTNSSQVSLLYTIYRQSTEAINFWLEKCVYPTDTQLFGKRIMSSSWDLASSKNAVGFSGTKDSHFLLPAQVQQCDPTDTALLGTDGLMLEKLLNTVVDFTVLEVGENPCWKELALYCAESYADALIDVGGLLAGTTNAAFSAFLRSCVSTVPCTRLSGILYFDINVKHWMVLEVSSGSITFESQSSILAKDCFVVFDDARSRGVDKKLNPNALAVLTLGPRLKKDKLMQGAGRMRQLGVNGQKLAIVGTEEVVQGIRGLAHIDSNTKIGTKEILEWTLANNKTDLVSGITQWTQQGLHFEACKQNPSKAVLTDDWRLEALYDSSTEAELLPVWLESIAAGLKKEGLVTKIHNQVSKYGQYVEVLSSQNEECERELQEVAEEEREVERQLETQQAIIEPLWKYEDALNPHFTVGLSTRVLAVNDAIKEFVKIHYLTKVDWSKARLFGTANFFKTIQSLESQPNFLRPLDAFLYYPQSDSVLLVSEKEADSILGLMWKSSFKNVVFGHLSQIKRSGNSESRFGLLVGDSVNFSVTDNHILLMQLLNAETVFWSRLENKGLVAILKQMTRNKSCRNALKDFVMKRGRQLEWEFSQLQALCERKI
ncbi:UNVERIFIED_CONTAM: hypothetical protein HDU68_003800 [Siphonaria sp. JEL0065]|nr:hypothetical protein HDU68_003800 [Siphonaria sp. JEL0065]